MLLLLKRTSGKSFLGMAFRKISWSWSLRMAQLRGRSQRRLRLWLCLNLLNASGWSQCKWSSSRSIRWCRRYPLKVLWSCHLSSASVWWSSPPAWATTRGTRERSSGKRLVAVLYVSVPSIAASGPCVTRMSSQVVGVTVVCFLPWSWRQPKTKVFWKLAQTFAHCWRNAVLKKLQT